jgi:hypothetical protein
MAPLCCQSRALQHEVRHRPAAPVAYETSQYESVVHTIVQSLGSRLFDLMMDLGCISLVVRDDRNEARQVAALTLRHHDGG